MNFVLSVPHDPCPPFNPGHQCDLVAKSSAIDLEEALMKKGAKVSLFIATLHRVFEQGGRDQNRPIGRGTKFRLDVEEALFSKGTKLVDVHSFPKGYDVFADVDILIMDPKGGLAREVSLDLVRLSQWIAKKTGLKTGTMLGSEINDIVVRARKAGRWAFLLEVNEGVNEKNRRKAMEALAEWLIKENEQMEPVEF